jgi:hypothetical protein
MDENDLSKKNSFKVTESKLINYVASMAFFIMFSIAVASGNINFAQRFYISIVLIIVLLGSAVAFLAKALSNKIIIEINESGIYYYADLITSWEKYISSKVTQEEILGSLKDNFVLLIEYYKVAVGTNYICKISLTNTQNKSEEDIIAAINNYASQMFDIIT